MEGRAECARHAAYSLRRATPARRASRKCRTSRSTCSTLPALADLARREDVGLTIVGPEVPLVAGIRDYFDARGLPCFGPSQAAAQLEGSKAFTKSFLERHRIPTAAYRAFTELAAAEAYIRERGVPIVIKADGLAAGKGVVVARTLDEALGAVREMLAGERVRQRGSQGRHRRLSRRRRSELHLHRRRSPRSAVREFAGPQDARRRRSWAEHRRHGRLFAGAGHHAGDPRTDHGGSDSPDRSTAWRRTACHTSGFCMRA